MPRNNNFCASQLRTTHKEQFIWTIDDFAARPQNREYSGKEIGPGKFVMSSPWDENEKMEWRIFIMPSFAPPEEENTENDYFLIQLVLDKCNKNTSEKLAKAEFAIRDRNGVDRMKKESDLMQIERKKWVICEFVKRDELLDEKNCFLFGNHLTIVFWINFMEEVTVKKRLPDIPVPESRIVEDFGYLFEQNLFTDCSIFASDGKEFKAHKCILASRCPVFAAMFHHEMVEAQTNSIHFDDIGSEVMKEFLRFIYNGTPGNIKNVAPELLIAAEKYNLERLKSLCENSLTRSLHSTNACHRFALGDLHSAPQLKTHAIDFIKKNLKKVKKSEGWKLLNEEQRAMLEAGNGNGNNANENENNE